MCIPYFVPSANGAAPIACTIVPPKTSLETAQWKSAMRSTLTAFEQAVVPFPQVKYKYTGQMPFKLKFPLAHLPTYNKKNRKKRIKNRCVVLTHKS